MIIALALIVMVGIPVKGNVFNLTVPAPPTESESIVVMDADTGVILYDKQGETSYMPASTTKVMTAILTMENLELDQLITVGPKPPFAEGSSMGFKEGEIISVENLLYCLLLQSANDSAEILAEAISGTTEDFAILMTNKAKEIGAVNTIFMNPSGLHVEGSNNYTTAKDLAMITAYAGKFKKITEIEQVKSYMLPFTNLLTDTNRWVANKNDLFKENSESYYEPVIFAKTGWTPKAGNAHTALAEKDGKRVIVSILRGASQKTYWQETKNLMEWAFEHTNVMPLYSKGQEIKTMTLSNGKETTLLAKDDFYYISSQKESANPFLSFDDLIIEKDYKSGEVIHEAKIMMDEKEIGTLDLISEDDILFNPEEEITEKEEVLTESSTLDLSDNVLIVGISVSSLVLLLLFSIRAYNISKRKKRRSLARHNLQYKKRKQEERY